MTGTVVDKDLVEARHWYEKAVDGNDVDAMQKLAYIYVIGESVAPDYKKASELAEKPLKQGLPVAQYVKAFLLENGFAEKKQPAKALELYKQSAKQGFVPAKEPVAIDRYRKEGMADSLLSLKTIGRTESYYILGKEYIAGKQTKKNVKKGLEYLNRAAEASYAEAYLELGKLYREGKVVRKNIGRANNYFKDAVDLGNKEAEQYLKK